MPCRDGRLHCGHFALLIGLAGCAGSQPPVRDRAPTTSRATEVAARTVFTDSALFRERCVEADSGLTLGVGRCTPRDQALRLRKP